MKATKATVANAAAISSNSTATAKANLVLSISAESNAGLVTVIISVPIKITAVIPKVLLFDFENFSKIDLTATMITPLTITIVAPQIQIFPYSQVKCKSGTFMYQARNENKRFVNAINIPEINIAFTTPERIAKIPPKSVNTTVVIQPIPLE